MKTKLLLLIMMLLNVNYVWAGWPNTKGIWDVAQNIARDKTLPEHDLTVGKAIDSAFPSENVLVFSNIDKLRLRVDPGVNGKFDFSIAHLAGGSYLPISVYVNGVFIGKTKNIKGKIKPLVSTFKTPMLYSHDVDLRLEMAEKGSMGIIYFNWKNTAYEKVPANVWKTAVIEDLQDFSKAIDIDKKGAIGIPEQINGRKCEWKKAAGDLVDMSYKKAGTALAVTHLFRATCWAGLCVKLYSKDDAVLSINGEIAAKLKKGDGVVEVIVKGYKMLSGLNRVVVRMPAGSDAKFRMEVNPLACRFLDKVPDIINPELNVDNWPRAEITNGKVSATVALPDPVKGFYRGPRFDHSGMIPELKFNGHTYFGLNAGKVRNPVANDNCAGPAEDFFEAIGFNEAEVGQPFIKVGVGLLEKPYARKYFFGTAYWPVKFFDWTYKVGENQVELTQKVAEGGWGYEYIKDIILPEGKNALVIKYFLKNTGKKQITTNQYAHNFIRIDNRPINSDYTVKFKGRIRALRPLPKEVKYSNGNTFTMYDKTMFTPLGGFKSVKDNCVDVFLPNKTGMKITGDFTPFRYWLFSCARTVSAEPFIHIDLAPGESMRWSRTYELYLNP